MEFVYIIFLLVFELGIIISFMYVLFYNFCVKMLINLVNKYIILLFSIYKIFDCNVYIRRLDGEFIY